MWKALRITLLLLVLLIVGGQAVLDRLTTTHWQRTVFVGVFPVNADASPVTTAYMAQLAPATFDEVDGFVKSEAHRYGVGVDEPVALTLHPALRRPPPALARGANVFARAVWSLQLRYYRWRSLAAAHGPTPKIALFVLYHDPALSRTLPHSAGLQRGLTAVVHVFADRSQERQNRIVVTHELLHTFGATDKYDPASGLPLYPQGFAEPELAPRYPQRLAEIMAGQRPLTATTARLPDSLQEERVGTVTAREVGWTSH